MITPIILELASGETFRLDVEVASTRLKRQRGLAGRTPRSVKDGMLFMYDIPTYTAFTVKDMLFSLFIAWFNEDGIFIGSRTVDPGPTPVVAPGRFKYVLELPSWNKVPPLEGSLLRI